MNPDRAQNILKDTFLIQKSVMKVSITSTMNIQSKSQIGTNCDSAAKISKPMTRCSFSYEDPRLAEKLQVLKRNYDMHAFLTKHEFKRNYIYKDEIIDICKKQHELFQKMILLQERRLKHLENNFENLFSKGIQSSNDTKNAIEIIRLESSLNDLHKGRLDIEDKRLDIFTRLKQIKIDDPNDEYDNTSEEMPLVYQLEELDIQESRMIELERITCDTIDETNNLIKDIDLYHQTDKQINLDLQHMELVRQQRILNKQRRSIHTEIYSFLNLC